ncbi:acetate--CoA ligase family protein [Nocardia carnea]|uniref:acetate--CoA ligase family protein n=1 Tax=Nocardia carnea TaxID=37328 RepID=UPI0024569EF3|nr:acetate--CoA ligase family protein [Nocardia carnea]
MATSPHNIGTLLAPASVAVIGASPSSTGPGSTVRANLLASPLAARTYAVNRKYADEPGFFASIAALPEIPDVAVVAVPAAAVLEMVTAAAEAGVRTVVVMSSGFAEAGPAGRDRETALREIVERHELTLLGPNTLGIFNFHTGSHLSFATTLGEQTPNPGTPGSAALITQSGAVGSYLCGMARPHTPFRYMISTGNEAVVTSSDLIAHLATDPDISVIALYLEGVTDGRRFVAAVTTAVAAGKHVVVLPAAESSASARAAASHTAALTSSNTSTRALAADAGAHMAETPEQLLGAVTVLQRHGGANRRGVGVVSVSGGTGVIVTDRLTAAGLEVTELDATTIERLRTVLPDFGTPGNPADTTAAAIYRPEILTGALRALAGDPGIGQVLTVMGAGGDHSAAMARALLTADAEIEVPHQVVWLACPPEAAAVLAEGDLPVAAGIADAVEVAATLYRRPRPPQPDSGAVPATPAAFAELPAPDADGFLSEGDSRALLHAAGLGVARPVFLPEDENDDAVETLDIGFPVAVKIQARGVQHKTEIGGVVLDVRDRAELRKAVAQARDSARRNLPDVVIEGWNIEPMAPHGVEILVGARIDPAYGPVIVVGAGGIYTELIGDVSVMLAPVDPEQARALLARTAIGTVLDGYRGRSPDLRPLCEFISRLSTLIGADSPLCEIECNPVVVADDGQLTVVDSLVRVRA